MFNRPVFAVRERKGFAYGYAWEFIGAYPTRAEAEQKALSLGHLVTREESPL